MSIEAEWIIKLDASDFPKEVREWCNLKNIEIYGENTLNYVFNDGNPLVEWMKSWGFSFKSRLSIWVAIEGISTIGNHL